MSTVKKETAETLKNSAMVGGRMSPKARTDLAKAFVRMNQLDSQESDDVNALGETVPYLYLCGPNTSEKELLGYTMKDIIHTDLTWRQAQADMGEAFLSDGRGRRRFQQYSNVLLAVLKVWRESDGGRKPYAALVNEDGSLHENATEEFIAAWGNGELGYEGLRVEWQAFLDRIHTVINRWRKRIANRKIEVTDTIVQKVFGENFEREVTVEAYADPTIRAFREAEAQDRAKAAEKERRKSLKVKQRDILVADREAYQKRIDTLKGIEAPKAGNYTFESKDRVIHAFEGIVAAFITAEKEIANAKLCRKEKKDK